METKDVVADIRRYWGSDHEYTDEELFAITQHQWNHAKGCDNADKDFVLQVVACRLEEELLLWLLQPQAADAAEDLQKLVNVCVDLTTEGTELLKLMLDSLLTATVVRAVGCDRNAKNRKRRLVEIVERLEGKFMKNKAWGILRTLEKCEITTEDGGVWSKFLELPNLLDARVFNSRSGRAFIDEARQIISQQQAGLAAVQRPIDDVALEGGQKSIAGVLWDIAMQMVELIEAKTDSSDTTEEPMARLVTALRCVESMAALEKYLESKESFGSACSIVSSEIEMNFEDVELSAIEQLSSICFSLEQEPSMLSDILEKVFDELSAIKSLDVISIQVSFLLGMQIRSKCCFVDHCNSAKEEFARRIRGLFNRLTGKENGLEHTASLVILSAFCPGQIIQQCIRGAQTDVLHHSLYLNVLRASPLLLDWNEAAGGESTTLLECELQHTLLDISSDQSRFDRESQNVMSFLLSLVEINCNTSPKRSAPVMNITNLLERVINPIQWCSDQSMEMQLNFLTLIQQFYQHLVVSNTDLDINSSVLETSFNVCLAEVSSMHDSDPRLGVLVRERFLLLLKNIMELMPDPALIVTLEKLDMPLKPSLWTLISLFNSDLGNDESCNGLKDVTTVEAYLQEKCESDSLAPIPLPNVISAIQVLLWGLLWDSTLSDNVSVESAKAEALRFLHTVAGYEFLGMDSEAQTAKGTLLIQSAVAEMMLECGSVLFQAFLSNIIPYLLEHGSTELPLEERLSIPKWATDKLSVQFEIELQIPCRLVSAHVLMRYVAKCWRLSGVVNSQLATPSNALLVESLGHVLATHDQAITSSQGSLSGTLFCIQWLCFLVSAACELHLDTLSTWRIARTQLELSLLRSLHQLDQLKEISAAEARFSQYFVATRLAYLPVSQFEQVFNFVASRANN